MRFKIDENLPIEIAQILTAASHDATTVFAQGLQGKDDPDITTICVTEERILVTSDLDFSDIRSYPPGDHPGFIVLRLGSQDKRNIIRTIRGIIPLMGEEPLKRHLWIVEEGRVRIRGKEE